MKKILATTTSLIMLISIIMPTLVLAEEPVILPPELNIYNVSNTIHPAGETSHIPMTIKNTGEETASNVKVSIVSAKEASLDDFSVAESSGHYYIPNISRGDDLRASIPIKVGSHITPGIHKIKVKIAFTNKNGTAMSTENTIEITVGPRSHKIPVFSSPLFSNQIGKDNKGNFSVNLTNKMDNSIYDVAVTVDTSVAETFANFNTVNYSKVSTISPNQSSKISLDIYVDSKIASGTYPIVLNLSYKTATNEVVSSKETVYVQLTREPGSQENSTSQPRIIISNYFTDVKEVKAGQEFGLSFTLKNTSNNTAVQNIKVTLSSVITSGSGQSQTSGEVFFPSAGSNSFYIDKMNTNSSVTNQIKLMTKSDIEPGIYPIKLSLSYEDANGKSHTAEDQISFPVTQEQRLDIQRLTIAKSAFENQPINLSFQYINKGKSSIQNFSVSVDGDFSLDGGDTYIGNLASGYNSTFDEIIFSNGGTGLKSGNIVLKFEDSQGKSQEKKIPIEVDVSSNSELPDGIETGGLIPGIDTNIEEPSFFNTTTIIIISLIILIVGAVIFVILKKKSEAKKRVLNDEEDWYS